MQFSITTIQVNILVVEAILHFSFSFFPYKIVLETLSKITACLAFTFGISLKSEDTSISISVKVISSSKTSSAKEKTGIDIKENMIIMWTEVGIQIMI